MNAVVENVIELAIDSLGDLSEKAIAEFASKFLKSLDEKFELTETRIDDKAFRRIGRLVRIIGEQAETFALAPPASTPEA